MTITELVLDQPAATLATLGILRAWPVPAATCPNPTCENGRIYHINRSGQVVYNPCPTCSGTGLVPPTVTGRITITANDTEPDIELLDAGMQSGFIQGFGWDQPDRAYSPTHNIQLNGEFIPLPLGRVVGTAAADIVPIVQREGCDLGFDADHVCRTEGPLMLMVDGKAHDIDDHRPFGDWTLPYAALLTDPTTGEEP